MSGIFLSYRRLDSASSTGRIYDHLERHFGFNRVFMDLDSIRPGLDFVRVLEDALENTDALIAIIGKQWLTVTDSAGHRRLDDPNDFTRLEIATALARGIAVFPVLVDGAPMPRTDELPEPLKPLTRRNALTVSNERFAYDIGKLIEALDETLKAAGTPGRKKTSGAANPLLKYGAVLGGIILLLGLLGIVFLIAQATLKNQPPTNVAAGSTPQGSTATPVPLVVVPTIPSVTPTLTPINMPTATNSPAPSATATYISCTGFNVPSRLQINDVGRVLPTDTPVKENSAPGRPSLHPQIHTVADLSTGATFTIIAGPQCNDSILWWQANYSGIVGWIGEGSGSTYWIEPVN